MNRSSPRPSRRDREPGPRDAAGQGISIPIADIPDGDSLAVTIVLPILGPFSATHLVARWFHEPSETRHWHEDITAALRSTRDHQAVDDGSSVPESDR